MAGVNRFTRFVDGVDSMPQAMSGAAQTANRFSRYLDSSGADLGLGGLPQDASPVDYAVQSMRASAPAEPSPSNPASGLAAMIQGEEATALAARQGTDPGIYEGDRPLRTPLGEATTDDANQVWFRDESGRDQLADRAKHVVLLDPRTGRTMVYPRDPAMDETRIKSLGRLLLPFLVTGPVTGASGQVAKSVPTIERAERLSNAARDLEAFSNLDVPTPGFAFGSGPMAATGLQLTELPIVGAPVRKQLEGAVTGASEAAGNIASSIGQTRTPEAAGNVVLGAMERGLSGTRDRVSGVADALSPTASPFDSGRALQSGVERARSANVAELEPGVVEQLGIDPRAPVPRQMNMSQGAANNAAEAAPIREAMGADFVRRGENIRSIPTETTRGVHVPSALPRDLTLTTRTTAEMLDDPQLNRLVRAPAAQTSFAARSEALYERAWRSLPAMMRENNTANPNMVAAANTRSALGQIDRSIANQIAGQGTIRGELAERLRNPQAANFTMADLRAIRTEVGRTIGRLNPLTSTLDGGQLRQLYAAITQDMEVGFETIANRALIRSRMSNNMANHVPEATARQAAGALRAFRTADRYYRAGQVRFERFSRLLRAENPEAASRIIINATKGKGRGDVDLVRTALAVLRPEERNEIASLVLREMGMPSATTRGIEQSVGFSGMNFQKAWREMSPAARNMLFRAEHLAEIETALQEVGRWDRVRSILGADRPEAVFGSIKRMALGGDRGDINKLRTVKGLMSENEWDEIRSAFIHSMGSPNPSAKGLVEKLGWSPTSMQTNYAAMSQEARNLMFTPTHQSALEDLFRVSSRLADVLALTNTSRSLSNAMGIGALLSTAGGLASGDIMGLLLGPAVLGSASLLLSRPQYARWAVNYARVKAGMIEAPGNIYDAAMRQKELAVQINRLSELARRNHELAPVLQSVRSENGVVESPDGNDQK